MVDKGIKPDEIVKCISSNLECKNKTEDYDFSEDSEDEVEKLEKEVYDEKRNGDIKNHNEDTESDTDLSNIAKKFETDSVFVSSHVDTLKRLKNFFEKNRRKLKEDKEYQSVNKIHFSNQANAPHQGNITNFYSDSITNIQYQNDTTLLNKKRNKN